MCGRVMYGERRCGEVMCGEVVCSGGRRGEVGYCKGVELTFC